MNGYDVIARIEENIRRYRSMHAGSPPTKIELCQADVDAIVATFGKPPGQLYSPQPKPDKLLGLPVRVTERAPRGGRVFFSLTTTTPKEGDRNE